MRTSRLAAVMVMLATVALTGCVTSVGTKAMPVRYDGALVDFDLDMRSKEQIEAGRPAGSALWPLQPTGSGRTVPTTGAETPATTTTNATSWVVDALRIIPDMILAVVDGRVRLRLGPFNYYAPVPDTEGTE